MFGQHVQKYLSAHAHGELPAGESERVAAHLRACAACRREFEEVSFGIRLAESLPQTSAPASLWDAVEASLARERRAPESSAAGSPITPPARREMDAPAFRRLGFLTPRRQFGALAAALCLAVLAGAAWLYLSAPRGAWDVARLEGAPLIDSERIDGRGRLGVGEWLETDGRSRAQIAVANIGQVEVDPNTRVRLVETRLSEHRLELQRGTLHARIWAPPRLFFVDTPSAVAADLGCAYTLEVDESGRGLLHVTSGWVALETEGRESMVPAGAACVTQPGTGPGTPFFEDAPRALVEALSRFDFGGGGGESLRAVLDSARARDTLTLWHLLPRAEGAGRVLVYDRLAALGPPPAGVTREGVLRLDRVMLDDWRESLENSWTDEGLPRKVWRKMLR